MKHDACKRPTRDMLLIRGDCPYSRVKNLSRLHSSHETCGHGNDVHIWRSLHTLANGDSHVLRSATMIGTAVPQA
jgi:hypothetical protein